MTNPIIETVRAWIAADEIDYDSYHAVMKAWVTGAYDAAGEDNPIHMLERGECSDAEFEHMLAAQILRRDGRSVAAEGLLERMFAATVLSEPMLSLLRQVRGAGLKTALLSNSWGVGIYPADVLAELFDAVVISAEVGMRKPEERIFRHATGLLGLDPAECVFIDDIEANVQAAEALGMTGVLHTGAAATVARVAELLGLAQRWPTHRTPGPAALAWPRGRSTEPSLIPPTPGRSANMRANRRTDTKPELALRSALHRQGFRFRKDFRLDLDSGARVRPDIAFTARRVAVFVDGCFWHVCPQHGRDPAVNESYWSPKLRRNVERDRAADTALAAAGWRVVRVWEHQSLDEAVAMVVEVLKA